MYDGKRTPTGQFVEVGDVPQSGESASEGEDNLQSQFEEGRKFSSEVNSRINVIVAPIVTQLETLILSVREINEKSSIRTTDLNAAYQRSRWSGQRSESVVTR